MVELLTTHVHPEYMYVYMYILLIYKVRSVNSSPMFFSGMSISVYFDSNKKPNSHSLYVFTFTCFSVEGVFFVLTGREVMLLQDKSTTVALVNKACWDKP